MTILIKGLLPFIAIFISLSSLAQERGYSNNDFKPTHEIRLKVGAFNLGRCGTRNGCSGVFPNCNHVFDTDFGYNDYEYQLYNGRNQKKGAISFGYRYNLRKILSIGADFTYGHTIHEMYHRITDQTIKEGDNYNFSFTPMVRLSYYKNSLIHLYGEAGVGVGWNRYNLVSHVEDVNSKDFHNECFVSYQVIPFGISLGRKIFGFSEVGFGREGSIIVGVGYKFNLN